MTGIAEMFAELDGYDRYEVEVFQHAMRRAARRREWHSTQQAKRASVERNAKWRRRNPEKFASYVKTWRDANPDKFKAIRRRAAKRAVAKNPEKYRAMWRANAARQRAKRKAAAS